MSSRISLGRQWTYSSFCFEWAKRILKLPKSKSTVTKDISPHHLHYPKLYNHPYPSLCDLELCIVATHFTRSRAATETTLLSARGKILNLSFSALEWLKLVPCLPYTMVYLMNQYTNQDKTSQKQWTHLETIKTKILQTLKHFACAFVAKLGNGCFEHHKSLTTFLNLFSTSWSECFFTLLSCIVPKMKLHQKDCLLGTTISLFSSKFEPNRRKSIREPDWINQLLTVCWAQQLFGPTVLDRYQFPPFSCTIRTYFCRNSGFRCPGKLWLICVTPWVVLPV